MEPSDEDFIRRMLVQGFAVQEETMIFDGVLVRRQGAAISPGGEPIHPGRQRILFQLVPEPKTVKNRAHLDVRLAVDGAIYLHTGSQGPHSWFTMADPEGNEFCIG
ncbi:VOC family protein [Paeniglutamicibacter cryotolerans]